MLSSIAEFLALVIVLAAWVPVAVFAFEVRAARRAGAAAAPADPPLAAGFVVLMPAHDEAAIITSTLGELRRQLRPQDRVLVVADNCSDDTEALARAAGAEVLRRTDAQRRGKGYALAHGIEHLRAAPPALVIVVDADCAVAPGALQALAARCAASGRPVQALYLMTAAAGSGTRQHVSLFAWRVKNRLRPRGAQALGWPCQLTGSGMALPWAPLAAADLAHGGIVEDMQLGAQLAMQGHPAEFMESALVTSSLAATPAAETSQRLRWEQGHLGQILTMAPRLAASAWRQRDVRQAALCVDLLVPPLALLGATLIGLAALLGVAAWAGAIGPLPMAVALLALLLFSTTVLSAWQQCGRDLIEARALPAMAGYMAMKVLRHTAAWFRKRAGWVKTPRDAG